MTRPLLVTGAHRSGTTWAGRILAASPGMAYLHEPFNSNIRIGIYPGEFDGLYQYLNADLGRAHEQSMRRLLQFHYPLSRNLAKSTSARDWAKCCRDQARFWLYRRTGKTPLIKDPLAFFSAEWLAERFQMDVLVLIRHPAAFCASVKVKNWVFDWRILQRQPALMAGDLAPYREAIAAHAGRQENLVEVAALVWNCIYHTARRYEQDHPDWLFVRHEDLSANPIARFESIFEHFGLPFSDRVRRQIKASSGDHNPVEQTGGNEFMRDSKANIKHWQTRLADDEIAKVKAITAEVANHFYSDADW